MIKCKFCVHEKVCNYKDKFDEFCISIKEKNIQETDMFSIDKHCKEFKEINGEERLIRAFKKL